METPECSSVDKCINKSDAHTNRGRLFKLLKKGDPPICRNMGEPGGLYAKWNKTDSKGEKALQDLLYIRNLIPLN